MDKDVAELAVFGGPRAGQPGGDRPGPEEPYRQPDLHLSHQHLQRGDRLPPDGSSRNFGPVAASYVGTPIHLRRAFQKKEWWLGRGYPWAATPEGQQMTYRKGDCPVAERRCELLDLNLGGGNWYEDLAPLVDQVGAAFRKVTSDPGRLVEVK